MPVENEENQRGWSQSGGCSAEIRWLFKLLSVTLAAEIDLIELSILGVDNRRVGAARCALAIVPSFQRFERSPRYFLPRSRYSSDGR